MQELGRHVEDQTQILFGTSVDGKMGNRLSVTLISSIAGKGAAISPPPQTPAWQPPVVNAPTPEPAMEQPPATAIPPSPATELATPIVPPTVPNEPVEADPMEEAIGAMPVAAAPLTPMRKEKKPITPKPASDPQLEALPPKTPDPRKDKFVQARQEVMQFEPITRGRFEKSEPTIVEGQDLDVPTYLRKNIRVK